MQRAAKAAAKIKDELLKAVTSNKHREIDFKHSKFLVVSRLEAGKSCLVDSLIATRPSISGTCQYQREKWMFCENPIVTLLRSQSDEMCAVQVDEDRLHGVYGVRLQWYERIQSFADLLRDAWLPSSAW